MQPLVVPTLPTDSPTSDGLQRRVGVGQKLSVRGVEVEAVSHAIETGKGAADMHCPYCRNTDTRVLDSRVADDGGAIRRRRSCSDCGKRFSTV